MAPSSAGHQSPGRSDKANLNRYEKRGILYRLLNWKHDASHMNDYFRVAVWTWIIKRDIGASMAAHAAVRTAGRLQRAWMIQYLNGLASDFASGGAALFDGSETAAEVAGDTSLRLERMAADIAVKDWTVAEATTAQRALKALRPEYYQALHPPDPTVFYRRHADLPVWLLDPIDHS